MPLIDTQSPSEQSRIALAPTKPNGQPGTVSDVRAERVSGPGRIVADALNPVLIYGDNEGDVSEFDIVANVNLAGGVTEKRERVTGTVSEAEVSDFGLSATKEPRA